MSKPRRAASKRVEFNELDSTDESEDEEEVAVPAAASVSTSKPRKRNDSSESDSDFEDPDEIEVPGGGKSLRTLQDLRKGKKSGSKAMPTLTAPGVPTIRLVGDVMPSNGAPSSLLKRSATAMSAPTLATRQPPIFDLTGDDDIEVVGTVPGVSRGAGFGGLGGGGAKSLLANRGLAVNLPGSMSALPNFGSTFNNPFVSATSVLNANHTDKLQQSMQSGGLSRLLQGPFNQMNPMTAGMPGMGLLSGITPQQQQFGIPMAMPGQLQSRQISSLWQGGVTSFRPDAGVSEEEEVAAEDEDDMGVIETYSNYMPSKLKIGKPHPDPVVETASLASVESPDVWYELSLPKDIINEGKLSALQLETVVYASQQHDQTLADGNRAGFLVGDGAGVGKGRTIAGIIFENYLKGRKRAIWVSVSNDLKYDAERDLKDIGADIDVYFLSKMKYAKINSEINNNVRKGVIYATYSALIGESQGGGKYKTRLKQLLHWCGDDFDGCIVFDECHRAKNLCPTGAGKPTKTGQTVLELQLKLPKARIVYASATGASEPRHMAYMVRLGIWGPGSPFRDFQEFLNAVEKRGVGAMEIVAMDMKLRGMYIARQLSFQGVSFRIDEVELSKDIYDTYNKAVQLWVDLMHNFQEAAELIDADKKMRKTMWGQFWSSHQRFFKYLCIASKVKHVVRVASEVLKMGKCIVIGLQSTGEARTLEAIEREEELTDFVSTAKGVLQSLVEKHFPAPDRDRISRVLGGLGPNKSMLEELGFRSAPASVAGDDSNMSGDLGKGKRKKPANKKMKMDNSSESGDDNDSDFEPQFEDDDSDDFEDVDDINSDYNPFGSGGSDDEDDPWARKRKIKAGKKKKKGKKGKKNGVSKKPASATSTGGLSTPIEALAIQKDTSLLGAATNGIGAPPKANIDRALQMKRDMLRRIEALGADLPANTLDQLIDELGGPENVSEMTGRKGRVVQDVRGDVRYESRSEQDTPLETLNLKEKDRFMNGEKDVAIISEAASSGISLQADRRVANRKRRVHLTLELPWSADRAIQQFGRTHRSNQVSAPEYVLLISDLAGEHRFASIVAKRLESLGALTHGDRRATESRDLSRFNIDTKYGRLALESTFKAIMGYEIPIVPPPKDYKGDFFKDVADGLVGVGLITQNEDMPGALTLDKGYNDMSKFLNRILGMRVELQNRLFKYFSDTLAAIVTQAKRTGKYDQGILDVGLTEEDHVELVKTHCFRRKHATGKAKIELHVLQVERGLSWEAATEKWEELTGADEGFYLSQQVRNNKKTAVLAIQIERVGAGGSKKEKVFILYRPNTGQQVKQETLSELKSKYKKVSKDEAEPHWNEQYTSSVKRCSHAFWKGNCKQASLGLTCEIGLRRKTYNVLTGSVLSVWNDVEQVLAHDGNRRGSSTRMQVVRIKLKSGKRIVGTLIPGSAMTSLLQVLSAGSQEAEETLY